MVGEVVRYIHWRALFFLAILSFSDLRVIQTPPGESCAPKSLDMLAS